jgi:hypothetical protein
MESHFEEFVRDVRAGKMMFLVGPEGEFRALTPHEYEALPPAASYGWRAFQDPNLAQAAAAKAKRAS